MRKPRRKKDELSVPTPRLLPSGSWNVQLRLEGVSITEPTKEKAETKAKAVRAGFLEKKKAAPKMTLRVACDVYISKRLNVLSPSTLHGYYTIEDTRFQKYMVQDIGTIDWQNMVNEEALLCSPKTLRNSWGFVAAAVRAQKVEVPEVRLPPTPKKDLPWLDYEQIMRFLYLIEGRSFEVGAILALHGLRLSELLAVTPNKIDRKRNVIKVEGAIVRGTKGMVYKETNKTSASRREVPILIPRLLELVPDVPSDDPIVQMNASNFSNNITKICKDNGLPLVGCHGLRRSFASLCWHLKIDMLTTMRLGGWDDDTVCRNIYTKLAAQDVDRDVEILRSFFSENHTEDTNVFTNDITNAPE